MTHSPNRWSNDVNAKSNVEEIDWEKFEQNKLSV